MFRHSDIPRRLLAVAAIAALTACSDATAPERPTLRPTATLGPAMPASVQAAVTVTRLQRTTDSVVVDFTVDRNGGWFVVGYNAVYFPPNSICEPATSGYGPGKWDRPCAPASRPVAIRGRAGAGANDRGWIHFDTDLRFVPSSNPDRWVRIFMFTPSVQQQRPADAAEREQAFKIFWVPSIGTGRVDESKDDPTLATRVLWGTGLVTRRVKHFSGYQVGNGYVEDAGMGTVEQY